MRIHSIIPAAAALTGLSALASAAETSAADPASAIRGSLGATLTELGFDTGPGTLAFLLNAGCLLLFVAAAVLLTRSKQRRSQHGHIALRSRNLAR